MRKWEIVCVDITLIHISVDDKPCALHKHLPPVHRIHTEQFILLILEPTEDIPFVTRSTGSVLSTPKMGAQGSI